MSTKARANGFWTTFLRHMGACGSGRMGPKDESHPTIQFSCVACGEDFKAGDMTTLVPLGPGDDSEAREKARSRRPYNAVAVEVHWACASGER